MKPHLKAFILPVVLADRVYDVFMAALKRKVRAGRDLSPVTAPTLLTPQAQTNGFHSEE